MMIGKEALEKLCTKQVAIALFNIVANGKYDMNEIVPYFDRIDKAIAELEELKKRDMAMKVILTPYKKVVGNESEFYMGNMYTCPKCHGIVLIDKFQSSVENLKSTGNIKKYCDDCGQRLYWSDKK